MYHEKLHLFFKKKGLKQYEIAELLGYSPTMISRYLKGTDKINADFIIKLVKEFPDVDLQYLFSDDDDDTNEMAHEPNGDYGLKQENIDKELEKIGQKIIEIRKVLAQNRHNK